MARPSDINCDSNSETNVSWLSRNFSVLGVLIVFSTVLAQDAVEKGPVPAAEAQDEAEATIKQTFRIEYSKTATTEKLALARKLYEIGMEPTDDSAARYVLLREAYNIAARAGDCELALRAVERIARWHEIDVLSLKTSVVSIAGTSTDSPGANRLVAENALLLLRDAVDQDRYDIAKSISQKAISAGVKSRDPVLATQAKRQVSRVAYLAEEYDQANNAAATLRIKPGDKDANLVVGKYFCFVKGNWDQGLPMLLVCSDQELRELADKELGVPDDPIAQVELADAWWALSENEKTHRRAELQRRAMHWYRAALSRLSGLVKAKVARRLEGAAKGVFLGDEFDCSQT